MKPNLSKKIYNLCITLDSWENLIYRLFESSQIRLVDKPPDAHLNWSIRSLRWYVLLQRPFKLTKENLVIWYFLSLIKAINHWNQELVQHRSWLTNYLTALFLKLLLVQRLVARAWTCWTITDMHQCMYATVTHRSYTTSLKTYDFTHTIRVC